MNAKQTLYYGLGQVAYALAMADGSVQKAEKDRFKELMKGEINRLDPDFDISDIIFEILDRSHTDQETAYEWAIKDIKLGSQYLTPELKTEFRDVLVKVADSFCGIDPSEVELINRFQDDIENL